MTTTAAIRWMAGVILAVLATESVLVYRATRRSTTLPGFATLAPNLAAGAFLVLAVAATTLPEPLLPFAACTLLAGVAHLLDLRSRLRARPPR